jgi:hypothetical protein
MKIFLQKSTRQENKKVEDENIFTKVEKRQKIKKWRMKIFLQKSTRQENKKVEDENIFTKVEKRQKIKKWRMKIFLQKLDELQKNVEPLGARFLHIQFK